MSKDYARIGRMYAIMVELLNLPKTIDVMRKMPAYVKGGEVYDFNDRCFGDTDMPDGDIFKDIERVKKTQAVTAALKRDYTAALKAWLDGEEALKNGGTVEEKVKSKKDKTKKSKPAKEVEPPVEEDTFNLMGEVKKLLKKGKVKKAKKLLVEHEEHDDYEKAYSKIEKAA